MAGGSEHAWWRRGVIYEIYPPSFQDTSGDGVGDLQGPTRRLDHLAWLGVDALWISPFFPSPMKDFGCDISSHTDVDPLFGTMADFDALLERAHERGLRVILDLEPNHTSDRHAWFVESRAAQTGAQRDWYIWRDPAQDGGPPNNWPSEFGGSAWELDEAVATRVGRAQARVAAMLALTLRAHPRCTTATRSAWSTSTSRPRPCESPSRNGCPGWGWAATRSARRTKGAVLAPAAFALRWLDPEGDDLLLIVNLGAQVGLARAPETLLAPPPHGCRRVLWSSDDPRHGGPVRGAGGDGGGLGAGGRSGVSAGRIGGFLTDRPGVRTVSL